jgi:UDP-N-acetylmuramoyl-tripeptide--D-alanyl-D-alanine ligase
MAALRLDEVARRTGGRIVRGSPGLVFEKYGLDSRLMTGGELFFAVAGRRDGHDFVSAAADRGAAGAVVSKPVSVPDPDFGLVEVGDTVAALQTLARSVLRGTSARVVGITGSIGKTTTKEFAAEILSDRYRVLKSEGNFNNRLGLPLSLLGIGPEHEVAVLEMGMSAAGEIRELTAIAPPDVAVITNVRPVHLQFFRSLDGIARAKREILDGPKEGATAVLNGDDPLVMEIASDWKGQKLTFGFSAGCDVRADDVRHRGFEGLGFLLRSGAEMAPVEIPFLNEAFVPNLLAAAAVGRAFGLSVEQIRPRIAGLRPLPMRGVLVELKGSVRLYDDSYNSNPEALEAVLRSLAGLPARRKVAVLADMLELGEREVDFHRRAGEAVVRWRWDTLITVGPLAAHIAAGAIAAGMDPEDVRSYLDSQAAAGEISNLVRDGDLVLVKGSRGMRAETIVKRLKTGGRG